MTPFPKLNKPLERIQPVAKFRDKGIKIVRQLEEKAPPKKHVSLMILLTIITIGIYPSIWYLLRVKEFNTLKTKIKFSKGEAISYIIGITYTFLIIGGIIFRFIMKEPIPTTINDVTSLSTSLMILFILFVILFFCTVGLFIHIAFRTRKIINEAIENKGSKTKASWFFTLIFNLFYLQYEINRIIDDKEEKRKIAPWIILILIILLIITGIAFILLR